jgi:hypothetical protein
MRCGLPPTATEWLGTHMKNETTGRAPDEMTLRPESDRGP